MSPSQPIPASWSELITKVSTNRNRYFTSIERDASRLESAPDDSRAVALVGPAISLAQLSVTLGPSATAPAFTRFHQHLLTAIETVQTEPFDDQVVGAVVTLQYINAARCAGLAVPGIAIDIETKWLPQIAPHKDHLSDKHAYTLAFAALAFGPFEQVPILSGGGHLPTTIEPGQTFQFNVQKYIRYMATAAMCGATARDVSPAFHEFVMTFPFKLGADSLGWSDLLYAARAYYVHFEHRPIETVSQTLHDFVTTVTTELSLG